MAMIVMYDLILGIDVSFYKSLIKISKIENLNQELAYVIYGNFDFLYNCLKKDLEKEEDYEFSKKLNR